ncbi:DUF6924 domain-containing protein [Streptomyces durocortorensis]|uniref:DUF6924 domain-containing protein n=1 Tax=Streptomyces durocortorensis TaxID=2811104 RepID=UPI003557EC8A
MAQVRPGADPEAMISDVVLIADTATMREPGHSVRVVPLEDEVGHSFRVDAEVAGIMVVNLALGQHGPRRLAGGRRGGLRVCATGDVPLNAP